MNFLFFKKKSAQYSVGNSAVPDSTRGLFFESYEKQILITKKPQKPKQFYFFKFLLRVRPIGPLSAPSLLDPRCLVCHGQILSGFHLYLCQIP